ncbi:MAG: chorismate synthase [Chloroflexi bacterium]|mgnify:FL=1|jgi:chorismate synthase|nr:chorismate synthase [Chloroflexota bacterium]MBT5628140.1 chorismate synthase [Chloroflexota bacterium]
MTTFRYLTAGESHGPGLTVIVEGIPAGLEVTEEYIEKQMARRQKGYGSGGRMKIEKDRAEIRAGVRHATSLGSPIAMWIENRDFANWTDAMSISEVADDVDKKVYTKIVPGHADFPGALKYVQHDLRNVLERASARETAARVAAGSIARRLLEEIGISIHSRAVATGDQDGRSVATEDVDWNAVEASEVRASDDDADARFKAAIDKSKKERTTIGGVFEVVAFGSPVGLGSHVHWDRKLDARLAHAMMSINAVKGVEIGTGFANTQKPGRDIQDVIEPDPSDPRKFRQITNHAGGIEGGMSNGNPIVVNVAIKPIATMTNPLPSVDINTGELVDAAYNRSDICQVARACPVGEAMMALVLVEAMLEKFGGDSLDEIKRNYAGYVESHQAFGNPE